MTATRATTGGTTLADSRCPAHGPCAPEDLVHQQPVDHADDDEAAMGHQRCTIERPRPAHEAPESRRIAGTTVLRASTQMPISNAATTANNTPITPHPGRAAFEMGSAVPSDRIR